MQTYYTSQIGFLAKICYCWSLLSSFRWLKTKLELDIEQITGRQSGRQQTVLFYPFESIFFQAPSVR